MPWYDLLIAAAAVIIGSELGWELEKIEWRRITQTRRHQPHPRATQPSHVHIIGHHRHHVNPGRSHR